MDNAPRPEVVHVDVDTTILVRSLTDYFLWFERGAKADKWWLEDGNGRVIGHLQSAEIPQAVYDEFGAAESEYRAEQSKPDGDGRDE